MTSPDGAIFRLHGARDALASGAIHLERQIDALEEAVVKNPGLAFDLAKTIIESTCKTVLKDRGQAVSDDTELPRLLKQTLRRLALVPDSHAGNKKVIEGLQKTARGLETVVQGICELRNAEGFASHGRDAFAQQLESVQAQLVARAADAVVHFLFKAHRGYPGAVPRKVSYEDHTDFNSYVDDEHGQVVIFDLSYKPSEILFNVDVEAYRNFLATFVAPGAGE